MLYRNQLRALALSTALTLAAVGMPAVHALAAVPGRTTQPHPIVTSTPASPEVHSFSEDDSGGIR
jgi:hypothetical protein